MVHKLPDGVSLEEGALVEPTAVAMQAVRQSKLKVGDKVAIFGAGPIGLLTLLAAKAAGASEIVMVDVSEERLAKAKELGAAYIVNAATEDTVQAIVSLTGGVEIAYEAAGAQPTFSNTISVLKKGGDLMFIAAFTKPVELDMSLVMIKELNVTSTLAYRHVFPEVINLMASGRLDVKNVITKKIELAQIVDEGLELLIKDNEFAIKAKHESKRAGYRSCLLFASFMARAGIIRKPLTKGEWRIHLDKLTEANSCTKGK